MASYSDSPGLSLLPAFGVSPAWQHHYSSPKQSRNNLNEALCTSYKIVSSSIGVKTALCAGTMREFEKSSYTRH